MMTTSQTGDFSFFFQNGGRRHLGFLKFRNINGYWGQEGQTASRYQILSRSVKPFPRYGDFSKFFQGGGRPPSWSRYVRVWTTKKTFGGFYHCAKFGDNRYSSFDRPNRPMQVFNILRLRLENAYSRFIKFGL